MTPPVQPAQFAQQTAVLPRRLVRRFPRRLAAAALLLPGWCALAALSGTRPAPDELRCTFVAVGHGNATLLELPDGSTLLYDAGRLGASPAAGRLISAVLWERGVRRLDVVVISHADVDHFNALPLLVERFPIGVIHAPAELLASREASVAALLDVVTAAGVIIQPISEGEKLFDDGPVRIVALHPPSVQPTALAQRRDRDNAMSVVLLVEAHGRRILLSGDLEGEGLERLTASPPLPCDVVLAPHHGSLGSNTSAWAAWCRPRCVVVSSGHADRSRLEEVYGPCGARLLLTEQHGAVTFRVSGARSQLGWFADGEELIDLGKFAELSQ